MFRFFKCLTNRLKSLLRTASQRNSPDRHVSRTALQLEPLESRLVPTVTYQGGVVLTHPDVQPLYLGSDWNNGPYTSTQTYLNGFLSNIVQSSYLPMLGNAGYTDASHNPIGQGTAEAAKVDPVVFNKALVLNDSQIQTDIQTEITNKILNSPNSQTVYVVYVEDNVVVQSGNQYSNGGGTKPGSFYGYHSAFSHKLGGFFGTDIHYAVIIYPGGSTNNPQPQTGLTTNGEMTATVSHELAEAATDPNVNYKSEGWYDNANNGEVGDITGGQIVYLNGYAVQRIADPNDQAMTPAGATPLNPVSFFLQTNGTLQEESASGNTTIATGVASVTDQGIDNAGQAMVDYITTAGNGYEYHVVNGAKTFLGPQIKFAVAGQGVSYFINVNNYLVEYKDASQSGVFILGIPLVAGSTLSAGTDLHGVNTVYALSPGGIVTGYSDSPWNGNSDAFAVASGVKQFSAGQQGNAAYVSGTNAYSFLEGFGGTRPFSGLLQTNVSQITVGTDQKGDVMYDVLFSNGVLSELNVSVSLNWNQLTTGVKSFSKGRAGVVDIVYSDSDYFEHTPSGFAPWFYLQVSEVG